MLVVIGLLIGGVLVGQSMIRTVELNRMGKEVLQIKMAADLFQTKYKYMAGDSPNIKCSAAVNCWDDDTKGNGTLTAGLSGSSTFFCQLHCSGMLELKPTPNPSVASGYWRGALRPSPISPKNAGFSIDDPAWWNIATNSRYGEMKILLLQGGYNIASASDRTVTINSGELNKSDLLAIDSKACFKIDF